MKTWQAKILVHAYYKFVEEVVIQDVRFFREDNQNYAVLDFESSCLEFAEKIALEKVCSILKAMKFVLKSEFECSIHSLNETTEGNTLKEGFTEIEATLAVVKDFPVSSLEEINLILDKYDNADRIGKAAFDFFIDGFGIKEHNNESFINFFKSIELISNEYIDEAKEEKAIEVQETLHELIEKLEKAILNMQQKKINNLIKQIYSLGFIEAKRKLSIVLRKLELKEYEEQISALPDLRNNVAHGKVEFVPITNEQLIICEEISRNVVLNYLDKKRVSPE
ncbi:hypothetical protein [Paenibacillus sp. S28]|uniref:hypothetical protein n=1 Tax=Paenibacillus sp. S28 TaxID=2767463 RepID=UPI00190A4897|nr:hypothetical protein [Paenibacillus sp. S28]MBJ9989428.1 hypothetical protein [Paenibacillus sp. S28]